MGEVFPSNSTQAVNWACHTTRPPCAQFTCTPGQALLQWLRYLFSAFSSSVSRRVMCTESCTRVTTVTSARLVRPELPYRPGAGRFRLVCFVRGNYTQRSPPRLTADRPAPQAPSPKMTSAASKPAPPARASRAPRFSRPPVSRSLRLFLPPSRRPPERGPCASHPRQHPSPGPSFSSPSSRGGRMSGGAPRLPPSLRARMARRAGAHRRRPRRARLGRRWPAMCRGRAPSPSRARSRWSGSAVPRRQR